MSVRVSAPGLGDYEISEDAWAIYHGLEATGARIRSAMALPDPLPAELVVEGGDPEPVVVLGTVGPNALVVTRDGRMQFAAFSELRVKFPPDGPYRLLFGWAEKGLS